jgi:hypothetical protein
MKSYEARANSARYEGSSIPDGEFGIGGIMIDGGLGYP